MVNNFLIIAAIIYLIGSIPFAFIITKLSGYGDIRNIGSGNVGTTNVLRTGNKPLTLIVLILDILKGYLPAFYVLNYISYFNNYELIAYILGSMSILGHLFPLWLKFKGGKGVATYIGFIFAINPFIGIIFIFLWLFVAFLKNYSSLASISSLITIPFIMMFFSYQPRILLFFFLISFILICRHYNNIKRLLNNNESKIKF